MQQNLTLTVFESWNRCPLYCRTDISTCSTPRPTPWTQNHQGCGNHKKIKVRDGFYLCFHSWTTVLPQLVLPSLLCGSCVSLPRYFRLSTRVQK